MPIVFLGSPCPSLQPTTGGALDVGDICPQLWSTVLYLLHLCCIPGTCDSSLPFLWEEGFCLILKRKKNNVCRQVHCCHCPLSPIAPSELSCALELWGYLECRMGVL